MSKPRGGLGRGLGALIPTTPVAPAPPDAQAADGAPAPTLNPTLEASVEASALAPVPGARFAEMPVDSIVPNPKQPRQVFDEEALAELKVSIEQVGFLQPIVVRDLGGEKYELVMGERRWRSAQAIGLRRHSGDRPGHPRRRDAPRRPAGEHPPGQPEPAGRGCRIPAVAGGVRRDARGTGASGSAVADHRSPTPSGC